MHCFFRCAPLTSAGEPLRVSDAASACLQQRRPCCFGAYAMNLQLILAAHPFPQILRVSDATQELTAQGARQMPKDEADGW